MWPLLADSLAEYDTAIGLLAAAGVEGDLTFTRL